MAAGGDHHKLLAVGAAVGHRMERALVGGRLSRALCRSRRRGRGRPVDRAGHEDEAAGGDDRAAEGNRAWRGGPGLAHWARPTALHGAVIGVDRVSVPQGGGVHGQPPGLRSKRRVMP